VFAIEFDQKSVTALGVENVAHGGSEKIELA